MIGAGRDRRDRGLVVRRARGIVQLHEALGLVALGRADLGPVDLAVGGDVEPHRAVDVADQDRALEVRPHGARAVGLRPAAGDPADAADDVLHEPGIGLRVARAEVAHAGVPRAPVRVGLRVAGTVVDALTLVELAPGHRVVLPHREGAGVVRPLVERREHVVVAADVAQVVVVLVGDLVAVGQIARREMVAVGDLDGGRVVRRRAGGVAWHRRADHAVLPAVPPVPDRLAGSHVRGVVHGGDAAAVLDVADDGVPLRLREERSGLPAAGPRPRGVQEQDRVVLGEVGIAEDARVLVRVVAVVRRAAIVGAVLPVDGVAEGPEGVLDNGPAVVDPVGVPESRGPGVDQDPRAGVLCAGRGGEQQHPQHDGNGDQTAPPSAREQACVRHPAYSSPCAI